VEREKKLFKATDKWKLNRLIEKYGEEATNYLKTAEDVATELEGVKIDEELIQFPFKISARDVLGGSGYILNLLNKLYNAILGYNNTIKELGEDTDEIMPALAGLNRKMGSMVDLSKTNISFLNKISKSGIYPNSTNSIIRFVDIWETGTVHRVLDNYHYEEKGYLIPETWDIDNLANKIDTIILNNSNVVLPSSDDKDYWDMLSMTIGVIPDGTSTVNVYHYNWEGNKFVLKEKDKKTV
jgi:hypothetical protein